MNVKSNFDSLAQKHQKIKNDIECQHYKDKNLDEMLKNMHSLVLQNQHTDQKFYDIANDFFGYLVNLENANLAIDYAKIALITYNLPIDPNRLNAFDKFHNKYGKAILENIKATPAKSKLGVFHVGFMMLILFYFFFIVLRAMLS
jgi:catalase